MSNNNDIKKKAWPWLWVSAIIVLLDQVSKYFAVHHLSYAQPYELLSFFNLWLNYNTGVAFGFFGGGNGWQVFLLSSVSILVAVVMFAWLGRISRRDWMAGLALSFILGGAIGNLIDRLRLRYVVDFFDFHVGSWHFATFNVADSAITVGACFLIIRLLFCKDR